MREALVRFVLGIGALVTMPLVAVVMLLPFVGAIVGWVYWQAASGLPDHRLAEGATSWHGCVAAGSKHEFVPLEALPANAVNAFLAGVDPLFWARTASSPFAAFRGGKHVTRSVLPQLYARALSSCAQREELWRSRSLEYGLKQALLIYRIERDIPKRNILETQINTAYFGRNSYGMAAAAQAYFNKPLAELSLGDLAFLASLPRRPSLGPQTQLAERRNAVLESMVRMRVIAFEQAEAAKREPLSFVEARPAAAPRP